MAIVLCVPKPKRERIALTGRNFKWASAVTGYSEEYLFFIALEAWWNGVIPTVEVR